MAKRKPNQSQLRRGGNAPPPDISRDTAATDQSSVRWLPDRFRDGDPLLLSLALCVLVALAYLPSLRNGFVNFDDRPFVYENSHVQQGLSAASIGWAFRTIEGSFWHPLTWLSFMADRQLFGPEPWGFHLTNLLLHAASTVLLFLALRRMTGAAWRSAFVAALFGLHPLHVESVAWVAERKDVLSTFFWMLAMLMYARYAGQSKVQSPESIAAEEAAASSIQGLKSVTGSSSSPEAASPVTRHASLYYVLSLAFFICGLMSKTMVVTLPLVLLLLDWWPLGRVRADARPPGRKPWLGLLLEKLPFLAASLAFGMLTLYSQGTTGALRGVADYPLVLRAQNAALSCLQYLEQAVWPAGLAVYYPYPAAFPAWVVLIGMALLALISVLAILARRGHPYMAVGWFWYLVTLLPVSGLIQMGGQSHADRYTYVPLVGVFLLATWGAADLARRWRHGRPALALAAIAIIGALIPATRRQVSYWKDSETLFSHALAVTRDNDLAQNNLGAALLGRGSVDDAVSHLREAVRLAPARIEARVNLGIALSRQGKPDEAAAQLQAALSLAPNTALGHSGLGDALSACGDSEGAIRHYREAVRLAPGDAPTRHNLAAALIRQGNAGEAIVQLREAIRIEPGLVAARCKLGAALGRMGQLDEAIAELREAVRLSPANADARCGLGDALIARGRTDEAIGEYLQAVRVSPEDGIARRNLGTALGIVGRTTEAVSQLEAAVRIRPDDAEARCNLGDALLKLGRLDEAIRQFTEALRLNPKLSEAYLGLGIALGKAERLDEAVAQFRAGLKLDPGSAELHCNLGVALARQGSIDDAAASFRKALALRPVYPDAESYLRNALQLKQPGPVAAP
ncbi:MAG: tetratricopeptide repeat protein [Verrucomicrobia bacterium]|nr:tetratricopeptide repeat protein [Verrucomicrobiota bacterium]